MYSYVNLVIFAMESELMVVFFILHVNERRNVSCTLVMLLSLIIQGLSLYRKRKISITKFLFLDIFFVISTYMYVYLLQLKAPLHYL